MVHLVSEHVDVGCLLLEHVQLALQVIDLQLQHADVFKTLPASQSNAPCHLTSCMLCVCVYIYIYIHTHIHTCAYACMHIHAKIK
jgi:hypothetical protein